MVHSPTARRAKLIAVLVALAWLAISVLGGSIATIVIGSTFDWWLNMTVFTMGATFPALALILRRLGAKEKILPSLLFAAGLVWFSLGSMARLEGHRWWMEAVVIPVGMGSVVIPVGPTLVLIAAIWSLVDALRSRVRAA